MTYNGREMFGVPTWAELRLDASELANLQRDCYREIHGMLDINIPEIDRKLSILSDKKLEETKGTKLAEVTKPKPISIEKSKSVDVDNYSGPASKSKHKTWTTSIPKLVGSTKPISNGDAKNATFARKSRSPNSKNLEAVNDERDSRKTSITQPKQLDYSKQADETDYLHDTTMMWRSLNYNDYEHLRPLPMPLGYYLKINRPEMIWEADRRVSYLKKKAEKRRVLTAERTLNALDQIRISSRASSNKRSPSTRSSMVRTMSRDSMPPNYQVKYNFSEQEMKRLTAKIYNRLPEVKKQRNQEVNKHLKVQNYKNKLDYGRKLVENRRRGIINYPLKSHYEESSIMSSLGDESLTNSLDRELAMNITASHDDILDYLRTTSLFEFSFYIFVANLTLQAYQFVGQLATTIFDIFKLAYGKEIFGQLTNDDLKPYSRVFNTKYQLLFKLGESIVLVIAAYFIAKSLLNFSTVGLVICMLIFILHTLALILGVVFLVGQIKSIFSIDTITWFIAIALELCTVMLSGLNLAVLFGLK